MRFALLYFSISAMKIALTYDFSLGMAQPQSTFQRSSNINDAAMLQELIIDPSNIDSPMLFSMREPRQADDNDNYPILPEYRDRSKRIYKPVREFVLKRNLSPDFDDKEQRLKDKRMTNNHELNKKKEKNQKKNKKHHILDKTAPEKVIQKHDEFKLVPLGVDLEETIKGEGGPLAEETIQEEVNLGLVKIGSGPTEAKNEVTSPPDQLKEVTLRNDVTTDSEEETDEMTLAETKIVNISENISKENTTPSETTDTTTPSELKDTTAPSESIDTTNPSESTGSETTETNTEITATDETLRNEQSKVPGKTGSFTVANERTEIASSSETEDVSTTIVQETSESATTAPAELTKRGKQPKSKSKKTKRHAKKNEKLRDFEFNFDELPKDDYRLPDDYEVVIEEDPFFAELLLKQLFIKASTIPPTKL